MTDAHHKPPQNTTDGNPFRTLDKKHFPEKRNEAKRPPAGKHRGAKASAEPDDHLFLQAMEDIQPLSTAGQDEAGAWAANVLPLADHHKNRGKDHTKKHKTASAEQQASPGEQQAPSARPQAAPGAQQAALLAPPSPPLTAEPNEFTAAMSGVKPLTHRGRDIPPEPEPKTAPPAGDDALRDFMEGNFEFALHHTDEYVEGHVIGLDALAVGKLQAGQCSPEGSLDLHGLNANQAYARLVSFIRNAYLRSWRTVLLVPGRGLNSPNGMPVLREKVQTWLTQEPLRRVVLAFCTAQLADGGAGALYVLLRKFRKDQGKVQWDRTPTDPDLLL